MKVIFAVDAIFPPLTGIGRYAWELASRLAMSPQIENLRFLSMIRWAKSLDELLPEAEAKTTPGPRRITRGILTELRRELSSREWAVRGYSRFLQAWRGHLLRGYEDCLYHSPNYFLPPFPGKAVATIHDLSIYRFPSAHPAARRKLFDLEMAKTLARAGHIITDSDFVKREVIDFFGWPESKITAIPLGTAAAFQPRGETETQAIISRYGLAWKSYVLCVSTLEPRKKIPQLLKAHRALPEALRVRFPLVMVGATGWLDGDINASLEEGRRAGQVYPVGFVPETDLPYLYSGAQAFCYPSIYEGFGLPVLEAMACGVPVLAANRTSLPEVAEGAAWLVDPDDAEDMRDGLLNLLENEVWRTQAIQRGLAVARAKNWDSCVARTVATYQKVLKE